LIVPFFHVQLFISHPEYDFYSNQPRKSKVYLILDNLRVHHSKLVKQWEQENKKKIQLFYLPSYSPDRNPDEYLNCDLKLSLSNKPSPKNEAQLKSNLNSHMRSLQKNKIKVANYFKHKSIKYAA